MTVSVTLQADIVSVTGTINATEVVWEQYGGAWHAVCARVQNGQYHVQITAVNSLGAASNFDFTLQYEGLNLITWRTQKDVNRVLFLSQKIIKGTATPEEQAEWLGSEMIGAYNASDLNRVGNAVQFVTDRLFEIGYSVATVGKDDWDRTDIPNKSNMAYYLRDIQFIRNALVVPDDMPQCPTTLDNLDYQKANDIEQILLDVDNIITLIMRSWMYAGEVYSGGMY